DGQVLAESPLVSRAFASFMSRRERDESDELLTVLRSVQQRYHYSDILLADARGVLRTSLSGFAGPLVADDAANLSNSLRERNVLLSELHTGPGGTAIYLDVVAPILDLSAAEPAPLGAIILRADARDFLFPLIQAWPTASGSAETVLVRREGENVLYLSELRNLRDSALRLRIPLSRTDVPAVMAVMGKEGIAYGKDYRG